MLVIRGDLITRLGCLHDHTDKGVTNDPTLRPGNPIPRQARGIPDPCHWRFSLRKMFIVGSMLSQPHRSNNGRTYCCHLDENRICGWTIPTQSSYTNTLVPPEYSIFHNLLIHFEAISPENTCFLFSRTVIVSRIFTFDSFFMMCSLLTYHRLWPSHSLNDKSTLKNSFEIIFAPHVAYAHCTIMF